MPHKATVTLRPCRSHSNRIPAKTRDWAGGVAQHAAQSLLVIHPGITMSATWGQATTIARWVWAERKDQVIRASCATFFAITWIVFYTWLVCTLMELGYKIEPPVNTLKRLQDNGHCFCCHIEGNQLRRRRDTIDYPVPLRSCIDVDAGQNQDSKSCFTPCEMGFGECNSPNSTLGGNSGQGDHQNYTCVGTTESGECTSWCRVNAETGMVYACKGDGHENEEEPEGDGAPNEQLDEQPVDGRLNIIFLKPDGPPEDHEGTVDTHRTVKLCVCRGSTHSCQCETAPLRVNAIHQSHELAAITDCEALDARSKIVDIVVGEAITLRTRSDGKEAITAWEEAEKAIERPHPESHNWRRSKRHEELCKFWNTYGVPLSLSKTTLLIIATGLIEPPPNDC